MYLSNIKNCNKVDSKCDNCRIWIKLWFKRLIFPYLHYKRELYQLRSFLVESSRFSLICRNFTDMKLMRDRAVNKMSCEHYHKFQNKM